MCHPDWTDDVGQGDRADIALAAGGHLPAWTYGPADGAGTGRVLLVPDIYGPVPFYRHLCALLARRGHHVTLVDPFFREGALDRPDRDAAFARLARHDVARALSDLDEALDATATGGPSGVIGFCIGGHHALNLAARRADLVTLTYYAFPEELPRPVAVASPRPLDQAGSTTGPILAFWGDEDYIDLAVVDRYGRAMADHGVDYEAQVVAGAGHGFLQGLVEDRADSQAARDAWDAGTRFLARHLDTRSAA